MMDPLHSHEVMENPYDIDSQSSLIFGSMMVGSPTFIYRTHSMDFSDHRLDEDDIFSSSLPTGPTASSVIDGNACKTRRRKASQPQRLVYCDTNDKSTQNPVNSGMLNPVQEVQELQSLEVRRDITTSNLYQGIKEDQAAVIDAKPKVGEQIDCKRYSCQTCLESFRDRKSWRSHVKNHNNETSSDKKRQACCCEICGVSLFNKTALKNHVKRIHEKPVREFKCQTCQKEFVSKAELTQHSFVHSQDKNFACDVCGKKFASKPYLERHVKTHTGDKPTFTCEVCGKQLSDKTGFLAHVRAHSGERPYECTVCGNKYTIKRHLTSHSRIHSEVRPFACEVEGCGKTFRSRSNLRMHRDFHAGVKRWSCSYCSRSFLSQGNMAKHVRRHLGEKKYSCDVCSKAFIEKQELKSHMKVHLSSPSSQSISSKKKKTESTTTEQTIEAGIVCELDAISPQSCESGRTVPAHRSCSFDSNDELHATDIIPSNRENSPCEVTSTLESMFGNRQPSSSSESVGHLDDMVVITLIDGPENVSSQPRNPVNHAIESVALLNPQSHAIGSSSSHENEELSFTTGNFVSSSMMSSTNNPTSLEAERLPCMGFPYHISDQVFNCTLCSNYYPEAVMLRQHLIDYHRVDTDKIH